MLSAQLLIQSYSYVCVRVPCICIVLSFAFRVYNTHTREEQNKNKNKQKTMKHLHSSTNWWVYARCMCTECRKRSAHVSVSIIYFLFRVYLEFPVRFSVINHSRRFPSIKRCKRQIYTHKQYTLHCASVHSPSISLIIIIKFYRKFKQKISFFSSKMKYDGK